MHEQVRGLLRTAARSATVQGILVAAAVLAALVATDRDYGMVLDEGYTVRRERLLEGWFAALAAGGRAAAEAFSPRGLDYFWPFSREEPDGHPPFYALLGLAGWWATHRGMAPLTSYRFGPMVLSAATVGLVYRHVATRRGRLAGLVAAGSMILIPQVFSLARYAHYDMPMSCLWILAQIAFLNALRSPWWIGPFGVALGLAAGTKFPGLFAAAPPILWTLAAEWLPRVNLHPSGRTATEANGGRRHLTGTRAILLGLVVAALTLYAIQPPWWGDPIQGFRRFVVSNTTRESTQPIPTLYLGHIYAFSLPWHNTLVLTAVSIPVGILLLGLSGIVSALTSRPADREGRLWVLSWLVLMVVRALPNAPGHDGIRLFLPSVLSLCMLAGIGVQAWQRWSARLRVSWLAPLLGASALGGALLGIVQLYPCTLSYYNGAIGGLKGAERFGFEAAYYWDSMDPEFYRWVDREKRRRPLSLRFPTNLVNIAYLREWGDLPPDVRIFQFDPGTTREDYVLQRRKGFYYAYDWWLEKHGRPEFVIRRQGVDLLRVYPFDEAFRAYSATRDDPIPEYLRSLRVPGPRARAGDRTARP